MLTDRFDAFLAAFATLIAVAGAPSIASADETPIRAVPEAVTTEHAGVAVSDPYRSLEVASPRTQAWVASQAAETRRRLDGLADRKALRDAYDAIDAEQPPMPTALKATDDGAVFYLKRMVDGTSRLFVRPADGTERDVLGPALAGGSSIAHFAGTRDGRRVAIVVTGGGPPGLEVRDVATGALVRRVAGVSGSAAPSWSVDAGSLIYAAPVEEAGSQPGPPRLQVRRLRLADGSTTTLAGWNAGFGPAIGERDAVTTSVSPDGARLFAAIRDGVGGIRLVRAELTALARDAATTRWTTVFDRDAEVDAFAIRGTFVYARTSAGALRRRIVRYDVDRPDVPPLASVPEQPGVIEAIAAARDGLYCAVRDGYESTVYRVTDRGAATKVRLPFAGSVATLVGDARRPGVLASLESWTRRKMFLRLEGTTAVDLALVPATSRIGGDWVAEYVACRVDDPAQTPMVVVRRADVPMDGSHPVLINGYGGYGMIEPAYFYPKADAWLQRGGLFVEVTPRGGGATGETSHRAAMGSTKPTTWKDFIACAETLVARGIATPAKLAIQGTGIGGVMVGRAMTERPDLFAAVVIRSGITDPLQYLEDPRHAAVDERELGDPRTADGVATLLAESTYHHIAPGVRYPAVLLTTGLKDPRIAPSMAFKTTARLTDATTGGAVLLRVDADGGLGLPSTPAQRNDELADRTAFLLWTLGAAGGANAAASGAPASRTP